MKKLAAIVAASILTLGSIGIGHCCSDSIKESQQYSECIEKYEKFKPGKDYAKGQILVGFDEGVTEKEAKQFLENCNLEMTEYIDLINCAVVKVPEGKEIEYVCHYNSIADETIVRYAEPDFIMRILPTNTHRTPLPLINI